MKPLGPTPNRPLWTEQLYRPRGGQDHLGLGSVVTDRMLPLLAPGINVLTRHPRYWSFYAFVLDEFWRGGYSQNMPTFHKFLRHKESIFAAANLICDPASRNQIIGTRLVGPLIASKPKNLQTGFNYMKSLGGGYGLYYATAMQTTGAVILANRDIGLPIDTLTPKIGKPLAESFRDSISSTKYFQKYLDNDDIPVKIVEEYGEACNLWGLKDDSDERSSLVYLFLHGGSETMAASRRKTLQMMLEISIQTNGAALNQDIFRQLVIYHSAVDKNQRVIAHYRPTSELAEISRRWRIAQLREIFNWSLNGMWRWICLWGANSGGDFGPVSYSGLEASIKKLNLRSLDGISSDCSDTIGEFVDQLSAGAEITGSLDGDWRRTSRLSEMSLMDSVINDNLTPKNSFAALFAMYLVTLLRVRNVIADDFDERMIREGGVKRISMSNALNAIERDIKSKKNVADTAIRVVRDHVISQHERIAMTKLPDDTFRFRREASKLLFFDQANSFDLNNSRFSSIASVCGDLRWTTYLDQPKRQLTNEGEKLRLHGDLGD